MYGRFSKTFHISLKWQVLFAVRTVIEFEPESDIHQFSPPQLTVDKTRAEIFVYATLTAEGSSDSLITGLLQNRAQASSRQVTIRC